MSVISLLAALFATVDGPVQGPWVVYEGGDGPGAGYHIVLVSGDEEYRSEEALPQLGKILAVHHGFKCTVLFAIDRETKTIDPNNRENIPGLDALATADLMIIATRFRDLPDAQMKFIDDYVKSGKPIIGLRTATHAFNIPQDKTYANYSWNSEQEWPGGFGRQILGETWVAHHGRHKRESTRGRVAPGAEDHPIARGVEDGSIWGPTDVYAVRLPLPEDCRPIVLGEVLRGMDPDDPPVEGPKNDPMMPIAWARVQDQDQDSRRVFTTTMGASTDLENASLRRLLVNAVYWCLGLEDQIPESGTEAALVGEYDPTPYGFDGFQPGVRPSDHALPSDRP